MIQVVHSYNKYYYTEMIRSDTVYHTQKPFLEYAATATLRKRKRKIKIEYHSFRHNLLSIFFYQMLVASVLGVPANRVVVRVKRMGKICLHTNRKIIYLFILAQQHFLLSL